MKKIFRHIRSKLFVALFIIAELSGGCSKHHPCSFTPEPFNSNYNSAVLWIDDIVIRVVYPLVPRYGNKSPVAIFIPGADEKGSVDLVEVEKVIGREADYGVTFIFFAFPGGGSPPLKSGGTYDHRGPSCIRALKKVIMFAKGMTEATPHGHPGASCRIEDIQGGVSSVGLIGWSNGGNIAGVTMTGISVDWFVGYENPAGEQFTTVELGSAEGDNLAYFPGSCSNTPEGARCDVDYATFLTFGPTYTRGITVNTFFLDFDGNGVFTKDIDYAIKGIEGNVSGTTKRFFSVPLLEAGERKGLITPDIATPVEAASFWEIRDVSKHYSEVISKNPSLKVILVSTREDHVQKLPDLPHVALQYTGWKEAGVSWIRLNPDCVYVRQVTSAQGDQVMPLPFSDNDANADFELRDFMYPSRVSYLEPEGIDDHAFAIAAVLELSDRIYDGNYAPNLSAPLYGKMVTCPARKIPSLPPVHVTFVSHNEEPRPGERGYHEDPARYMRERFMVLKFARTVMWDGGAYNFQSDWSFLKAVTSYDAPVSASTKGKNILQFLREELGVSVDPHAHETTYNYADVAYLIYSAGVQPSGVVGGFLYDPPDCTGQCLEEFWGPITGWVFPHTWTPEVLWGASTYLHSTTCTAGMIYGCHDDYTSGIWRPKSGTEFYSHDPTKPPYVGGCGNTVEKLWKLLENIESGTAPSDGFYTYTIFVSQRLLTPDSIRAYHELMVSLAPYVLTGRVIWADIEKMVTLWDGVPFQYDCSTLP